jgi:hypothetical protein
LEVKLDLLTRIQTLFILALGAGIGIIPMTCQFEHVMRISSEYSADEEFISVTPSSADGVYQADGLIPEELRKVLIKGVYAFENVDKSKFDRLPGSNEQVLDLVHPSLFCYVIDLTIIQRGIWPEPRSDFLGSGVSEEVTEKKKGLLSSIIGSTKKVWQAFKTNAAYRVHRAGISKKFQWLSSEFMLDHHGKVQIRSYINNLHPELHKALYGTLERIFEQFIPLFNKTLTEALYPRRNRNDCLDCNYPFGVTADDPNRIAIQPPLPEFYASPTSQDPR